MGRATKFRHANKEELDRMPNTVLRGFTVVISNDGANRRVIVRKPSRGSAIRERKP